MHMHQYCRRYGIEGVLSRVLVHNCPHGKHPRRLHFGLRPRANALAALGFAGCPLGGWRPLRPPGPGCARIAYGAREPRVRGGVGRYCYRGPLPRTAPGAMAQEFRLGVLRGLYAGRGLPAHARPSRMQCRGDRRGGDGTRRRIPGYWAGTGEVLDRGAETARMRGTGRWGSPVNWPRFLFRLGAGE